MAVLQFIDTALGWLGLVIIVTEYAMWTKAGGPGKARRGIVHISRYPSWFRALLPFMWIGCALVTAFSLFHAGVLLSEGGTFGPVLFACLAAYWVYSAHDWYHRWKNTDDDFWRKKRERTAGKIQEIAGKLVVVPELKPVPVRG